MTARDHFLAHVRLALGREAGTPVPPVPGRIAARRAGPRAEEMEALLREIAGLGGRTAEVSQAGLAGALALLVEREGVRKATAWATPELKALGIGALLERLGVEMVSPHGDKVALAGCDLGVTGADAAFPETGTLLLRSSPERPRMVSLLPRIHLAIITPEILLPDLSEGFERVKGEGYFVFVTGPSRTADIELNVTIGVHGPKTLYVWNLV